MRWMLMRIKANVDHQHWSSSLIINILKNGRFVSGGRSRESSPFVKASSRPRPSQPPVILADFSTYGCVSNLSYYVFCNCLKIGCMKTDKPIFSIATTASIITKASLVNIICIGGCCDNLIDILTIWLTFWLTFWHYQTLLIFDTWHLNQSMLIDL